MGENSKVVIDEVSEDIGLKKKKAVYSMLKGKAMFYITRLFKYKYVSAIVKTPTAVAGVRGTKFGVEIEGIDREDRPKNLETIVYCFDGKLEVSSPVDGTSQYVNAGQSLALNNMGAGMVEITESGAASRFDTDTNILEPVSDFNLLVTDGTHSVSITNEKGEFTDPKNSSHFVLPTGNGQWMIDGVPADTINKKNAYGSVYGPGADSIGGVWKIDADPAHATGVFHGTR